jgi:hypothetical protein
MVYLKINGIYLFNKSLNKVRIKIRTLLTFNQKQHFFETMKIELKRESF